MNTNPRLLHIRYHEVALIHKKRCSSVGRAIFEVSDRNRIERLFERADRGLGLARPSPGDVEARCSDGRNVLVAVDDDGEVLAYGDLEADGHLDHLYCLPEAVGRGIASALYDKLESIAYQKGLDRIYTEASEAARRLFLHKGFEVLHKREFKINHVMIHNYAMEKKL